MIQILTIDQVEQGNNQWHNALCHNAFGVFIEIGRQDADFGHKYLCEPATYDAEKRSHHDADATVWDENQPEKLVEQFQVGPPLENETSVRKPD